jgi:hypothetical protein
MADRKRSHDGKKETDAYVSDLDQPDQQGRSGGDLARDVGTRDALKRAEQADPGVTRVRKSDEEE